MNRTRGITRRASLAVAAVLLCVVGAAAPTAQTAAPTKDRKEDAKGFKEFTDRVQKYLKLQQAIEAALPAMAPTDLPELIAANQQTLARKIREARPHAKAGDIFTSDAREAFRHASRAALEGPHAPDSRAYMKPGASPPGLPLAVNAIYPETGPVTALSPALLASFPPLPESVAYRVVGRTLVLVDVKANLIVDVARFILAPLSPVK